MWKQVRALKLVRELKERLDDENIPVVLFFIVDELEEIINKNR